MREHELHELQRAKDRQLDAARPDAVDKVHSGGKLTARERIAQLLDPESEVEFGSIAAVDEDGGWVPEAGGVDFVGTVGGHTVIASSTDYTDRGGGYGAARMERLMGLAHEHRWPVVFFVDGGGSRARHPRIGLGHRELSGPIGRFQLFDGMAELSGWAPSVAIVSGPSFAGHASIAGFSDFVISTPGSSIGMGGPPMVEAALGLSLTPNELAGAEMHETGGGIDLLAADEHEAIAAAKRYLGYLHDHDEGPAPSTAGQLLELIPDSGPTDMAAVAEAIVDQGSMFELRPAFARNVITAFARLDGSAVGVLASQPSHRDGELDEAAAVKISRFVELCDAYDLPMLSLIDSPGTVTTWPGSDDGDSPSPAATEPGFNRWHSRAIMAQQHRQVPLVAVQVGRAGGLSSHMLAGSPNARALPLAHLAWPSTEVRSNDGFSALGNGGVYDDVIDPRATRTHLVRLLRHLEPRAQRRARTLEKRLTVDTW